jgi:hypothetical protein
MRDLFVVAFLSRNLDRSRQWLGAEHFGRMSRLIHVVAGNRTTRDHHNGARKRSRHKRYFHFSLLITFDTASRQLITSKALIIAVVTRWM